ncbi:MAG: hypothetical protein Q9217_005569 [Psora testacea]
MVEDEFLTTAQAFTKHLHYAEYQRLKNSARDRNAGAITKISRPTDNGRTRMRREVELRKQAEKVEAKARAGVDDILSRAREGRPGKGGTEESEFEMEQDDDEVPWQGTQLQGFMTTSPRKGWKSLVGLHGVASHTRAAAGLERAERRTPRKLQKATVMPAVEDGNEEDEDTDDLEAPSRASAPHTQQRACGGPSSTALAPPSRPRPTKSAASTRQPPKRPPPRSFLDMAPLKTSAKPSSDPLLSKGSWHHRSPAVTAKSGQPAHPAPTPTPRSSSAAIRAKLQARREKEKEARERKNDGGGGLKVDEIPVFLV